MSQKTTSQQSECDHIQKIVEFEYYLEDGDVKSKVKTYGCTKCDILSSEELYDIEATSIGVDHTKCGGPDVCFGCKAQGLQLNPGDAVRDVSDKKWNSELQAYRDARAAGMQPAGTTRAHVEQAYKASEVLGKAYDADTMPKARDINQRTAEVLKEVGMV